MLIIIKKLVTQCKSVTGLCALNSFGSTMGGCGTSGFGCASSTIHSLLILDFQLNLLTIKIYRISPGLYFREPTLCVADDLIFQTEVSQF